MDFYFPNHQLNIDYLSPFVIKEILYILINDKSGYFLNKFAMEGSTSNKIVKIISESSFYQNFKTVTSMSPLQFQKKLRLEEAKQLLSMRNIEVSEVAYTVGYESPSQFSREFSRMFGLSAKTFINSK